MSRKSISLVICLFMLASNIMGCMSEKTDPGSTETSSSLSSGEVQSDTDLLAYLPEGDFEGYEFRILGYSKAIGVLADENEFDAEEESGEVINDALYRRNRSVEEKYNCNITYTILDEAEVDKTMQSSVMAGDNSFDMFTQRAYRIGGALLDKTFLDWNLIEKMDFTKPWWVEDAMLQYNIGDTNFIAVGDMLPTTISYAYAMYFNKKLVSDYNIEDPYKVVEEGRWTIDYLIASAKGISYDLDGDQQFTYNDMYGLSTDAYTCIDAFSGAVGQKITSRDSDNMPTLVYNTDKMQAVTEKLNTLYWGGNYTYVWRDLNNQDIHHVKLFSEGRALYLASPVRDMFSSYMRGMSDDFGVLPYPKYDEAQEEYTAYTLDGFGVQLLPATLPSDAYERTGIIVEALNAESYALLRPALYEVALKNKMLRDMKSEEMLDLVLEGRRYDLASIYASKIGYWWMLRDLVSGKKSTFTSSYEKNENKALKAVEDIVEAYNKVD